MTPARRPTSVRGNIAKGKAMAESLQRQLLRLDIISALEHRFHPVRAWRVDLVIIDCQVAVEIEGGVYIGGAHTRGAHFEKDCEKYAELAIAGWRLIRVTPRHVTSGRAAEWIRRAARLEE